MTDIFHRMRTWAEIDLDAVEHNFNVVRNALPEEIKLLAVIKANAYGHGAVQIAKLLEGKADYFAVAMTDEALELRENGIKTPILILGHVSKFDFKTLVKHSVTCTVSDLDEASVLAKEAQNQGKTVSVHIAIDTGMSRIGFAPSDSAIEEIRKISYLDGIEIEGIFSHFAAADCVDKSYAELQLSRFSDFCKNLDNAGIKIPIKHLYNSAAISDLPPHFDMVREGIILYGLKPSDEVEYLNIEPIWQVMSLRTHITQIKTLPADIPVSYGCTYTTKNDTRVATLCAGYADGVPRLLSNKGSVLIKGKRAPIIGRVCMDQFMVDVTHIPEAATGDTATIFGTDGDLTITADEVAATAQTIGYETVCNINRRVPRVYIKNGKVESVFSVLTSEKFDI